MSKIERETIVDFEFKSQMLDIGSVKMKLRLLRKTPALVTNIKYAKARMLGGQRAASPADDLHFDVMATLANGVEPVPNPKPLDPTSWVEELLDPASWYAIYDKWQEYQASFTAVKEESGNEAGA